MKPKRYKLWTRGNRGRYFPTLAAATKVANKVFRATGIVLCITEERRDK